MKSYVVFPQTAWVNSDVGFAGIAVLADEMKKKNVKFKLSREYQALIFEIEGLGNEIMTLIRKELPAEYEIPALVEGFCSIISKDEVIRCDIHDKKFDKLMRDAHLKIHMGNRIEEVPVLSSAEINKLCNDFADREGITWALKEFDIDRLQKSIDINKEFERRLIGILVDVKGIWFALEYDMVQLGRNTGKNTRGRFKRYMHINNAIVRIRALWEKLIGLAILLERPSDFDRILSAKRVRSAFIKNFKDSQHPVAKVIWDYLHSIDTFEQRFRTPELHKIGRTIWWAAREKLGEETNRFIAYRNDLNRILRNIVKIFEEAQG